MMSRHKDRQAALKILFELDLVPQPVEPLLRRGMGERDEESQRFVEGLVRGTLEHRATIDEVLSKASVDWRLDRMPTIDRNILRIAAYELLYEPDLPISIIIDEAVELAKTYSTDEARRFINGVLSTVASRVRPQETANPSAEARPGEPRRPALPPA
jgi:N utilization substance protein B